MRKRYRRLRINLRPVSLCLLFSLNFFLALSPFSGASPIHLDWNRGIDISHQNQPVDPEGPSCQRDIFDVRNDSRFIQRKQKRESLANSRFNVVLPPNFAANLSPGLASDPFCWIVPPGYYSLLFLFHLF